MREANIFLFAVAGVVLLLTLAVEPPSSKTWWGGLIIAGVVALFALTGMILSGGVAWHGVNPWGAVLIFGGPAVGLGRAGTLPSVQTSAERAFSKRPSQTKSQARQGKDAM